MHVRRAVGYVVVTAVVIFAGLVLFFPAIFAPAPFASELPSPVAGERVPLLLGKPDARIAVAGDTGTGTATEKATAERMWLEGRNDPYDALLLLGDLVYEEGDAGQVESRVTGPFASVISGGELLPVLGNHDYRSDEQQQILTALGRRSPWYVEQVGPVRVIVLDSNRVGDVGQLRWLRETLSAPVSSATWTIVAMHHPAYSAGHHGSDLNVRNTWGPLVTEFDVPLVLAGHDHDYQRSIPQNGVTYVVSGAGAKLRATGREGFTAVSDSTLHYVDLVFYDDRILGRAIDQTGRLVDAFTIRR